VELSVALLRNTSLLMLEEDAKAPACASLQDSQSPLNQALWGWDLGSGQRAGEVRLDARMSSSKRALLSRLSPAHRASDGQYMSQRELFSFHSNHYSTLAG
jgi:hypothetical protein